MVASEWSNDVLGVRFGRSHSVGGQNAIFRVFLRPWGRLEGRCEALAGIASVTSDRKARTILLRLQASAFK